MSDKKQKIVISENILGDAAYSLFLKSKLQKSRDDIKNGRVMTIEQAKERMKKKYTDFNVE